MRPATDDDRARWIAEGNKLLEQDRVHFTDIPCPKCGKPTLEDNQGRWRFCMFNDGHFKPALQAGSPPPFECDYGIHLT